MTSPPDNFAIRDVTTRTAFLSWDEVFGAKSYKVRVVGSIDDLEVEDASVEATSYLVTSLQPGTEYQYTVRSVGRDDVTYSQDSDLIVMATCK